MKISVETLVIKLLKIPLKILNFPQRAFKLNFPHRSSSFERKLKAS
jgi:hypothetical protein